MRILIVHSQNPFPADNGGKLRAAHVAAYLARKHPVAFVCFGDAQQAKASMEDIPFHQVRVFAPPAVPRRWRSVLTPMPTEVVAYRSHEMRTGLHALIESFAPDVLLTFDPAMAPYLSAYDRQVRVLDYLMVLTLSLARMAALESGWSQLPWHMRWYKQAWFHRRIAPMFDLCLVNSREDLEDLQARGDGWQRIEFVPNGVHLDDYPLALAVPDPLKVVYPGSVRYPPNRDAVKYFIDEILPRIRQSVPEVQLLVTGEKPHDQSAPMADGVSYTGYVPDVRAIVAGSSICVVPLRSGAGGARYKVLESLALGTPIVSTSIGAEGLDFQPGHDLVIADHPADFAAETIRLLSSAGDRDRLAAAGRELIEKRYNWDVLGDQILAMLDELIARKK
ncbi:MAG: glycosyltransferase family 4 protein [Pirellulaceae bacterium]|nr:glycosyltransferase [Planctomycetales bacterium]